MNMQLNLPSSPVSPFARHAQRYIDAGLPVLPIAPGTKKPGEYKDGKWIGMYNWTRYGKALPTEEELERWSTWPDAGIGLICGALSGVVGLDVDTDDEHLLGALGQILPASPVRKKGKKGFTSFCRFNGEESRSWRVNGATVLDLLSDGRQTLMPGTVHPDGMTYVSLSEDTLDNFDIKSLPSLPGDFVERLDGLLAPLQTEDERQYARVADLAAEDYEANPPVGFAAEYYRSINSEALLRLDAWVPLMIPTAKASANGYRCRAFWRGGDGLNVGITPMGIRDFAGDYGMTAIDLVMNAQNVPFADAAATLRQVLGIPIVDNPLAASNVHTSIDASTPDPSDAAPFPLSLAQPSDSTGGKALELDQRKPRPSVVVADASVPDVVLQAPGMLARVVGWMAETAPKYQPELFLAAALALVAAIMGRLYRTEFGNWPSLYMVMVAYSGEGKEHPMQCVKQILEAAGFGRLLAGSGYTSPGAVFSALHRAPSHLTVIDEMGKLLKMTRAKGNAHGEAAIDKLVEAFGAAETVMKPAEYSTMSLNSTQLLGIEDRVIHNPAISLLGATTPGTFYEALTTDLVKDGFLGRVLAVVSRQPHQLARLKPRTPPPEDIVQWVQDVHQEGRKSLATYMVPGIQADPVPMSFDSSAIELLDEFELELLELKPKLSADELDVLLARTREKAMRIAMLAAKATNPPQDNTIRRDAVSWSIAYARHYDLQLIEVVQSEVGQSKIEKNIKKVLDYMARPQSYQDNEEFERVHAYGAMPASQLHRAMKWGKQEFQEVMETVVGQGRVTKKERLPEAGFAGVVYFLRKLK